MSLAIKYENVEDAQMRLRNTVVLYKESPVLIKQVVRGEDKGEVLRVMFEALPLDGAAAKPESPFKKMVAEAADELVRKFISSKHFDIAPFKLGYVNAQGKNGAFYCMRMPNRVQKQGLCGENFKGNYNDGGAVNFATFLTSKDVPTMVANRYPTFEQALRALDKVSSIAFHRDFCLVKDDVVPSLVYLYHKGVKIGMCDAQKAVLGNKFNCLKECLEELRIKVGVS